MEVETHKAISESQTLLNSISDDTDTLAWFLADYEQLTQERERIIGAQVYDQLIFFMIISSLSVGYALKSVYEILYSYFRKKKYSYLSLEFIEKHDDCGTSDCLVVET
jgi:hypothetical protein